MPCPAAPETPRDPTAASPIIGRERAGLKGDPARALPGSLAGPRRQPASTFAWQGAVMLSVLSNPLAAAAARFLAVGGVGLAVDAALYSSASRCGAADWSARALSLALATLVTWRLNRRFTFGASAGSAAAEGARYALVAAGAQGFNYALFLGLRAATPWLPALGALLLSAVAAAAFSFCGQRFFTFTRQESPGIAAARA
jgi:putative flippase GtrA